MSRPEAVHVAPGERLSAPYHLAQHTPLLIGLYLFPPPAPPNLLPYPRNSALLPAASRRLRHSRRWMEMRDGADELSDIAHDNRGHSNWNLR